LPALSQLFGIHPWDIERLTVGELRAYLAALAEWSRAATAAREAGRGR
jgi:hypothetical protein